MTAKSPLEVYSRPPQGAQHPWPPAPLRRKWQKQYRPNGIAFLAINPDNDCFPENPHDMVRHGTDSNGGGCWALADGEYLAQFDSVAEATDWLDSSWMERRSLKLSYLNDIRDLRPPSCIECRRQRECDNSKGLRF